MIIEIVSISLERPEKNKLNSFVFVMELFFFCFISRLSRNNIKGRGRPRSRLISVLKVAQQRGGFVFNCLCIVSRSVIFLKSFHFLFHCVDLRCATLLLSCLSLTNATWRERRNFRNLFFEPSSFVKCAHEKEAIHTPMTNLCDERRKKTQIPGLEITIHSPDYVWLE